MEQQGFLFSANFDH